MADLRPTEILLSGNRFKSGSPSWPREIRRDFPDDLHLVAVLKGAFVFLSDLVRHMPGHVSLDFMALSSYAKGTTTSGEVRLLKDLDTTLDGTQRRHRRGHRRHRADAHLSAGHPPRAEPASRCAPPAS